MTPSKKSKALCSGCRENYYNGNNPHSIAECWNYESARLVRRFRIGWWTPQKSADDFTPVEVLSCFCETGRAAYYEKLPAHLRPISKRSR